MGEWSVLLSFSFLRDTLEAVMRSICILFLIVLFAFSCTVLASDSNQKGPAPNSGDCIPDGSGFDSPGGPDGSGDEGHGPAPNSGDGIPDGSGMDSPYNNGE